MATDDPAMISPSAIVVAPTRLDNVQQMEHFAELGRLSASLLHEISNPLSAALLYLEQYENRHSRHIRQVRRNILLLQRYVEAARQQVRHQSETKSFYVRGQVDQVRRVLLPLARRKGVNLQIKPVTNYKIYGDPVKFQQILANLIINAIDAYDLTPTDTESKPVTVTMGSHRQWLIIKVNDQGSGIPAAHLSEIFEPFYTTKVGRSHNLGIGLAVVKQRIEQDFDGSITVNSSVRNGTQFTVRLRLTPRYH